MMTTWVEDIRQALKNLGGEANLKEIYEEVKRVRDVPLPRTWKASVRERIESHSSDSKNFKGKDYFYKIDRGVWGLRDIPIIKNRISTTKVKSKKSHHNKELSSDEVSMVLSTLNDYRSYYDPKRKNWGEYIDQMFYIFGFNIKKIDDYHQLITALGSESTPKAVVYKLAISDDFSWVISDLKWETLLNYAVQYFQTRFGVITDGLRLKIIDYANNEEFSWLNFDEIIKRQYEHSFQEIYQVILSISTS